MASTNISIVVEAIDQATKTLDKVKGELSGVGDAGKGIISTLKENEKGLRNLGIGAGIGFAGMSLGIKKAVDASSTLQNSMVGLKSIVEGTGGDFDKAKKFVQEFTADGLVATADAATSLKNLLSRGFSLDEASVLMDRFKNSAAFGRQASLGLGEAVRSATEGLKNENSILVDNAGVTKNVSMMWKDYAKELGKSEKDLTQAEKRQAELNGIMQETKFQMGDAAKYAKEYSGQLALATANTTKMWSAIGDQLKPALTSLLQALNPVITAVTNFASAHGELVKWVLLGGTALLGVVAGLVAIGFVIPAIVTALTALGAVFALISAPVLAVIAGIGGAMTALYIGFQNNTGGIRDAWNNLMTTISTLWTQHGGYIRESIRIFWEYVQGVWRFGVEAIKIIFTEAMTAIAGLITIFDGILTGNWKKIWEGYKTIVTAVFTAIGQIIRALLTEINTFIKNAVGVDLLGAWNTAWTAMGEGLYTAWEYIKEVVGAAVEYVKGLIQPLISMIQEVKSAADSLVGYVSDKISQARSKLASAGSYISSSVSSAVATVTGKRALGGPVDGGRTYLVGENGPELFTPTKGGSIISNGKMGGGMNLTLSFGDVHITNGMDMEDFSRKVEETIYKTFRSARLGL